MTKELKLQLKAVVTKSVLCDFLPVRGENQESNTASFPHISSFSPWFVQKGNITPRAIWLFRMFILDIADLGRWELFHLIFSNQIRKSSSYIGALGCMGARLAGLVLTALLLQLVMKGAWFLDEQCSSLRACLCHNLICIHFLAWDAKPLLIVQATEAQEICR